MRVTGNGLYLYLICICFSEKSTRDQSREVYLLIDNILVKNDLLYETLLVKICFFMRPILTRSALLSRLISAKLFIVRASSRKVLFLYEAHLV